MVKVTIYVRGWPEPFILAKTASLPTPEGPERTISNGLTDKLNEDRLLSLALFIALF